MSIVLGLIAIVFGSLLVRFREDTANAIGEPMWASKVGGMQIVVIISGVLICLWGLATMTGTTDILFAPILSFFPRPIPR